MTKEDIPFYLRIKGNTEVAIGCKKHQAAYPLFTHIPIYHHTVFNMRMTVLGQSLWLAASRNARDQLMIIITHRTPKNAIASYLRRWEIETLFAALKSKGWRLEDTHLTQPKRIERLLVLLAIGFVWAHKIGEWKASLKPIILKTLRKQRRPQNSFFRWGLDNLRDWLTQSNKTLNTFKTLIKWLLIPPIRPSS